MARSKRSLPVQRQIEPKITSGKSCSPSYMAPAPSFKLDAALSVAKKTLWQSRSLYVLLQVTNQTGVREISEVPELLSSPKNDVSEARANVEASYTFLERYGSYFVKTGLIGSSLTSVIRLDCVSEEYVEKSRRRPASFTKSSRPVPAHPSP